MYKFGYFSDDKYINETNTLKLSIHSYIIILIYNI